MISSGDLACSLSGIPDLQLLSIDDFCQATQRITNMTRMPLIVDADDGFGFGRGDSSIPHKTGWSFGVSARKNSLACPEDGGKKRKHQSNTKLAAHDPKILTRLKSFKTSRIGRRLVQRRLALLSNVRTHRKGSRASIRSSHPIIRSIVPRGLCCDSARRGGAARLVCNAQPVLRRKSEFSKAH